MQKPPHGLRPVVADQQHRHIVVQRLEQRGQVLVESPVVVAEQILVRVVRLVPRVQRVAGFPEAVV